MDRYGIVSDVDHWSVYCERINEIAVMGLRERWVYDAVKPVLLQLNAAPISQAVLVVCVKQNADYPGRGGRA